MIIRAELAFGIEPDFIEHAREIDYSADLLPRAFRIMIHGPKVISSHDSPQTGPIRFVVVCPVVGVVIRRVYVSSLGQ